MSLGFSKLKIHEFSNWEVYLHECQCYLGWVYILHRDKNKLDLLDINDADFVDLKKIVVGVKDVVRTLFFPDMFNYASLGNEFRRLHVHIIPRYKTKREFCHTNFNDNNWGHNYAPYDKSFFPNDLVVLSIKKVIQEELCKAL
jgi:diadenosine tetraphosphate (Ap4A) HIT family hydrolase